MLVSLVKGAPALLIKKEGVLVVGDLHIGLDLKYRQGGMVFQGATKRMSDRLLGLCDETGAERVVIVGDVKDSIGYPSFGEFMELKAFFAALKGICISVTRGNHDGALDRVFRNLGLDIPVRREEFVDGVALMHGNAWPSEEAMRRRYLVCGHMHFAAESAAGKTERAWLMARAGGGMGKRYERYNKGIRLIFVPPFNDLILGSTINSGMRDTMSIFKQKVFDWKSVKVYGLDGSGRRPGYWVPHHRAHV